MKTITTLLILVFATTAFSDTIHIPEDEPTIHAALAASGYGWTLLVAPGLYESTETLVLNGQHLIGESGNPEDVIIRMIGNENVVRLAYHFSLIENVTVTGGWLGVSSGRDMSTTIRNCIIRGNTGGGVYHNGEHIRIEDTIIDSNGGDGINILGWIEMRDLHADVIRCTITNNGGGGIITKVTFMTLEDCVILNNQGYGLTTDAWDFSFWNGYVLEAENCVFHGNNPGGDYEGRALLYPILLRCCDVDEERWLGSHGISIDNNDCGTSNDEMSWGQTKMLFR